MKDIYGRILQCPRCYSILISRIHKPLRTNWFECQTCGFRDEEIYFRAIPREGLENEIKKEVKEEWNPSRR